jgi:hypothetical protein
MTFATQIVAAFAPIAATYDAPSVTRAQTWAQSFVEGYCNRTFDLVTAQVDYITPSRYRQAIIPNVPVVNVETLFGLLPPLTPMQAGLQWIQLTNFAFVTDTGLIYDTTGEPGIAATVGSTWPRMGFPASLKVTYDYGFTTVPQGLVDVACRAAQQYLENPALQMGRKVGDLHDSYFGGYSTGANIGAVGPILPDHDRRILGRYVDISIA